MAILIDGLLLGLLLLFLLGSIGAAVGHHSSTQATSTPAAGAVVLVVIVLWLIGSVPVGLYYGFLNGSRSGQTLGKMAMGIAVRDVRSAGPIGFWRAFGRYYVTAVFAAAFVIPLVIDSLSPLWDGRNQAWHDKVAHSVVVDLRP